MVVDITFTLAFLGFPVAYFSILRFKEKKFIQFSFFHFVVIAILITQYCGLLPLYFGWPGHRAFIAENNSLIIYIWTINIISLLGLLLGRFSFEGVMNYFKFGRLKPTNIIEQNHKAVFLHIISSFYLFFTLSTCLVIYQLTNKGINLETLAAASSIVQLRNYANLGFFNYLDLNIVWYFIVPFFSLAVFFAGVKKELTYEKSLALAPFIVLALIPALMTFEKRPVIDVGLALAICGGYILHGEGYLQKHKFLLTIGVGLTAGAILFAVFLIPELHISKFLTALIDRTFFGQLQSTYLYVEIFPEQHPYLAGASMYPFIISFEPEDKIALSKFVYEFLRLKLDLLEGGTSPTIFWGEIYANFGVLPIFFCAVFVGIMLETVSLIVKSVTSHSTYAISYTWLGLHYTKFASTSFSSFIVDIRLLYLLALLLSLSLVSKAIVKYSES